MSSFEDIKSATSKSENSVNDDPDLKEFDFTIKSAWSDLEFKVEGKTLYVTRSSLAIISPIFRRMFTSQFKEKEAIRINLPDENIFQILPLVHEYHLAGLWSECCVCLMQQLSSNCNAVKCEICLLANQYDLQNLIKKCISIFWNISSAQYRDLELFNTKPLDIRYKVLYARLQVIDKHSNSLFANSF
ncbi:hypothetical protein ACJMK2_028248 [Sinanodonta woodiana]|uniref:BTB domain-containing protein n=1 Tax=Sinanodonta woodiana TaxID=1069815 RepID=A0ABD3X6I1_SINWO